MIRVPAPPRSSERRPLRRAPLLLLALAGCPTDAIVAVGEFGRPLDLATGDASALPRLVFQPGVCRGEAGGCPSFCAGPPGTCPEGACLPILIDSGSPVTFLPGDALAPARSCFEVRSGRGVLAAPPDDTALSRALTRFRFESVPLVRLPREPDSIAWGWQVGDGAATVGVGGVIGGNLLRELAVRFTDGDPPQLTLYREFPGTEDVLADQGSAALPLQFPGLLLGKLIDDVCQVDGDGDCDFVSFGVFDRERPESALQATRMVLDACLGPPPAAVIRDAQGKCALAAGPGLDPAAYRAPTGASGRLSATCRAAVPKLEPGDLDRGHEVSLVVATGLPGLVLFEDSALRLFGSLALPPCAGPDLAGTPACLEGQAGLLRAAGWPPAGSADAPLTQLRVRSLALLPGLAESVGAPACQRLEVRLRALRAQCESARETLAPHDTAPATCRAAAATTAAILGEAFLRDGVPSADAWIPALVVPAEHPLVAALRRDVSPEALQPDGLLGTALLRGTDLVLDYTDPTPSVRVACVDTDRGDCLALPACSATSSASAAIPACCFGLPEDLLVSLIRDEGAYGCCAALSPATAAELNSSATTEGREPPCPARS